MDFTFDDVKQPLDDLFEQQYILTLTSQTETRTDDEGNDKEYKILNVTLVNKNITMLTNTNLTDDQRELYGIYLESKGNRDYLFADDIYSNPAAPPELYHTRRSIKRRYIPTSYNGSRKILRLSVCMGRFFTVNEF